MLACHRRVATNSARYHDRRCTDRHFLGIFRLDAALATRGQTYRRLEDRYEELQALDRGDAAVRFPWAGWLARYDQPLGTRSAIEHHGLGPCAKVVVGKRAVSHTPRRFRTSLVVRPREVCRPAQVAVGQEHDHVKRCCIHRSPRSAFLRRHPVANDRLATRVADPLTPCCRKLRPVESSAMTDSIEHGPLHRQRHRVAVGKNDCHDEEGRIHAAEGSAHSLAELWRCAPRRSLNTAETHATQKAPAGS